LGEPSTLELVVGEFIVGAVAGGDNHTSGGLAQERVWPTRAWLNGSYVGVRTCAVSGFAKVLVSYVLEKDKPLALRRRNKRPGQGKRLSASTWTRKPASRGGLHG
jgi:hypothetical protein